MASATVNGGSSQWSSSDQPVADRFEAWHDVLARSFARFNLIDYAASGFRAQLATRSVGGMNLVACRTSACAGVRSRRVLALDDERRFGIQVLLAGEERFTCGERTLRLGPGSVVFWDSALPGRFEAPGAIAKATIVFSESLLRERLPRDVPLVGTTIDASSGLGAILRAHATMLVAQRDAFDSSDSTVRNITLDLLAATLRREGSPSTSEARERRGQLGSIQAYIRSQLADCELAPSTIARANGISLRYLHLLFHNGGTTVAAWTKEQRLLRCRDELAVAANETVAQIAYRAGFSDAANFSREFKRRFGCSPSFYRLAER